MTDETAETVLEIGGVIRFVRLAIHMSQEDLARTLGVGRNLVGYWETGSRKPRPLHLVLLREVLRRPMLRMRLWRSEDVEKLAIQAKLAEPIREYVRAYARGARLLITEGLMAEMADA